MTVVYTWLKKKAQIQSDLKSGVRNKEDMVGGTGKQTFFFIEEWQLIYVEEFVWPKQNTVVQSPVW